MLVLPPDSDALFAEFLRENGVVTPDAIRNVSGTPSGKLIETLISNGAANEDVIAESLMHFFGINHTAVDAAMAAQRPMQEKLNTNFILRTRIAPLEVVGSVLKVALADPDAFNNVNDVKMMAGCSVETYVTTLTEMGKYMQALQSAPAGKPVPAKAKAAPQAKVASVHRLPQQALLADFSGKQETEQESHSEVINFVNEVIMDAVLMGVSDIHIESFREKARVRFRRDGVLQDMAQFEEFLTFNYSAVTTRIKILASLDISERRLPQDGGISSDKLDKAVDIRVSVLPTVHGERIVLRILDPDAANFTLDQIGMPEGELKKLRKAINSPQGMLLVTGPTGSGKSTTLYAILKELNDGKINIMTAEDPVEYDLFGIGQVQVRDDIGLSFTAALRSFLRQDPEVIMVGEIRDKDTSDIAIKAALTGHLVLSTLHTNDAPSTITRLINMGVPAYLLNSALTLVLAQRLARKNCPHCRVKDEAISKEELISIGFPEDNLPEPMIGKGCEQCMETGIRGRRPIHEVLPVTQAMKEAIFKGASDSELSAIAHKEGFHTMQEIGRDLVRSGEISVNEYKRILVLE